jgi:2-octaprenyl-6-methoxyphenol hydroxylase
MNVCLIGDSLTGLVLAKSLINKKIKVFLYYKTRKNSQLQSRTIGISKKNLNFINKEIINIKRNMIWDIKKIEIYNEKMGNDIILNFEEVKKNLFSMVKNNQIYKLLDENLKKEKLYKKILIKNNEFYKKILKNKDHDLIINCDGKNNISKSFFYKKFNKNYNSHAYTTIIKHKNTINNTAIQIFTKKGPIAFLPISSSETSVVFSKIIEKENVNNIEIKNLIRKCKKYKIIKFSKVEKFSLNFSVSRNYYYKNILAFGDSLHKIHPLAGQGFNMSLRDIKILSEIIQSRIDLGLELNHSIYKDFEKKNKHLNFIFSSGIDFIYEFFKFDSSHKSNFSNKLLKQIGQSKLFNQLVLKYANQGLII